MASEEDKEKLYRRYKRMLPHLVGRDEELRRKQAAKARRAADRGKAPRRRQWDDDGDDETFAKMPRRAQPAQPSGTAAAEVPPDLPRAIVTAVRQGRIELDSVDSARLAARLHLDPDFRLAVGDEVAFTETEGPPRIEAVLPRRSWLGRPDPGNPHREQVLVANVDVAVIVASVADPPLRTGLIDRFLLALERGGVAPVVCANKIDLLSGASAGEDLAAALLPYEELGVSVVRTSASLGKGIDVLRALLAGKTCVFVGHSGVGKSSLLNAIDPDGDRSVGEVRAWDGKGRHTTTQSSLRELGDGTRVIDTPGIRSFGVDSLDPEQVRAGFAEFAPFARACRFGDCSHRDEPDCAVHAAAAAGKVSAARYASYLRIVAGLEP
jgi:ribosome biogenesis GTPase